MEELQEKGKWPAAGKHDGPFLAISNRWEFVARWGACGKARPDIRAAMSIKIMSFVWEHGPQKQADRFVLLAIADYANDDGEAWPSIAGICRKTCMSERGVQVIIRRLEAQGWLEIETGRGRKNCNLYAIKNPAPHAPRTTCPPHMDAENPHMDAKNPAPHAPEPSYNHQEPSKETEPIGSAKKKRRKPEVELPDGWVPSDRNIADAAARGFSQKEASDEADRFRNYHHAKGSRFRDWDAAWRTWLGNARKFSPVVVAGGSGARQGGQRSSLASIVARRHASGYYDRGQDE